jgi:cupin fold WbuC family metalloprotein
MQPESYIRPHRHALDPKPECFIALQGRFVLLTFDDQGAILSATLLGPREQTWGVDLPPGIWHCVVCMERDSVLFETKPGPFDPLSKKDPAPWAPNEASSEAQDYLSLLKAAATRILDL